MIAWRLEDHEHRLSQIETSMHSANQDPIADLTQIKHWRLLLILLLLAVATGHLKAELVLQRFLGLGG